MYVYVYVCSYVDRGGNILSSNKVFRVLAGVYFLFFSLFTCPAPCQPSHCVLLLRGAFTEYIPHFPKSNLMPDISNLVPHQFFEYVWVVYERAPTGLRSVWKREFLSSFWFFLFLECMNKNRPVPFKLWTHMALQIAPVKWERQVKSNCIKYADEALWNLT